MATAKVTKQLTDASREQKIADGKIYGPLRTVAGKITHDLLLEIRNNMNKKFNIFLDAGTLLGATRSGKMIPHDDDFDMGVFIYDFDPQFLVELKNELDKVMPTPYKVKLLQIAEGDYADKLEVYDENHGFSPLYRKSLDGTDLCYDYANVVVDLQLYVLDGSAHKQGRDHGVLDVICHHTMDFNTRIPLNTLWQPDGAIGQTLVYEDETFHGPIDSGKVLESKYGYLGSDAVYNEKTNKYEKAPAKK